MTTLPNRRMGRTVTINWQDNPIDVTFNHDDNGKIIELFFKGDMKEGTALQDNLIEFGILVSKLIQTGMTIEEIHDCLKRDGDPALVASALKMIIADAL